MFAAAVTLLLAADHAAAGLPEGRERFLHGDYEAAAEAYRAVRGAQRDRARLELARIERHVGDYEDAEKHARLLTKAKDPGVALEARVLLADVLRLTGRYAEAKRELEPQHASHPDHLPTRHLLALLYLDLGQSQRARQLFNLFFDDYEAENIDVTDAEQLFYVAEAARYLESFDDANGQYREVIDRAPKHHRANIAWGRLFLSKYAPGDAEQSFDEVLKIDPHHPDAHAGMAAVKLEASYDLAAAEHHLEQALRVNPRHVPSLLIRAGLHIDKNQWSEALATLGEVFAINPEHFEGRALEATVHWLRDDTDAYEAAKQRVFAINPEYAEFFHIVARSAVREHRYVQAIELEKEAVRVDPRYFEAMQAVGTGYLRLGKEKEGLEWLRKAWRGDEYNVRTDNTLDLFENILPKSYSFVSSKSFKIRYHNDEQKVLRRYLEPMLEGAYADMVRRYDFRPAEPVIVELFRDSDHYSVRTVGLPNLGALGVCFGQVITAMSPSVGDINWAMILHHELSHVFAIQISKSRVPRWYTEGLSEYETVRARPEWRRENDSDLWAAMQDGTLPSVAELNYGFMKADMQQVVVAYHLSSVTIEYIAQRHGFDAIVRGLHLFGEGLETPAVIERITGQSVAEFDAEFRGYLEKRLAHYRGTLHIPTAGYDDLAALRKAAIARPNDARARADLALGHFYDGDAEQAGKAAAAALELDSDDHIALYVSAELALRNRDLEGAKSGYERLLAAGGDSFDVRARLGLIAARAKDFAAAEQHLCAAKALDPERSHPYELLADLYTEQGREDEALRELETYVMIEQMELAPVERLVRAHAKAERWHKVVTFGERALELDPARGEILLTLGRAYLETGRPQDALFTYDTSLLVVPPLRRPALAEIGRAKAHRALGDRRAANQAIEKALRTEPDNADALRLKRELASR